MNSSLVALAISLNPGSLDRRTLAAVQHAIMDRGGICGTRDKAIESIYLSYQVPLAQASNRGIARHGPDRLTRIADQRSACALPRRCGCRLTTSVAAADHDHVQHCLPALLLATMVRAVKTVPRETFTASSFIYRCRSRSEEHTSE